MNPFILAVDFDGTLCESAWPGIGEPKEEVIRYVKTHQERGAKLILWTNRVDKRLDEALDWCQKQGIIFDAVNENLPEIIEHFGTDPRKIFANEYLDDRAVNLNDIFPVKDEFVRCPLNGKTYQYDNQKHICPCCGNIHAWKAK